MTATFLVVPQWQGSGSSRAMRLADGAAAIRAELPVHGTILIEVPPEAGSDEDSGVLRLSSIRQIRDAQLISLADVKGRVISIGGDCGIDLAGVHHAAKASDGPMAVIWLDAHADLNTPDSSPSGAFHGMVLRTLLGDGTPTLLPELPLDPRLVILAGTRALEDAELSYIEESKLTVIEPNSLDTASITAALAVSGATSVYFHVDLDVLDPAEFASFSSPEPFGVSLATVLDVIAAAKKALPLIGAAITGFAPANPQDAAEDLASIMRIVGALAR